MWRCAIGVCLYVEVCLHIMGAMGVFVCGGVIHSGYVEVSYTHKHTDIQMAHLHIRGMWRCHTPINTQTYGVCGGVPFAYYLPACMHVC